MKDILEISNLLDHDIIPNFLNFTINNKIDIEKITYNSYYNSFQFFASKFAIGWQSIPGFDDLIQNIANNSTSPLEEMNERFNKSIETKNEKALDDAIKTEWIDFKEFNFIFKKNI
jgi:hypothetical protein